MRHKTIPTRQKRLRLWPHVGKQHAAHFLDWVGIGADLVSEGALVLLVGLMDAFALGVVFPAMVRTPDAVFGGDAMRERSAAVWALLGNQTQASLAVLENDQIFPEQSDSLGPFAFKVNGRTNRLPIASHELAHGRASSNFG